MSGCARSVLITISFMALSIPFCPAYVAQAADNSRLFLPPWCVSVPEKAKPRLAASRMTLTPAIIKADATSQASLRIELRPAEQAGRIKDLAIRVFVEPDREFKVVPDADGVAALDIPSGGRPGLYRIVADLEGCIPRSLPLAYLREMEQPPGCPDEGNLEVRKPGRSCRATIKPDSLDNPRLKEMLQLMERSPAEVLAEYFASGRYPVHLLPRDFFSTEEIIEGLNLMRSRYAIPPLQYNTVLAVAAKAHDDYMRINNQGGHDEQMSLTAATGENPGVRIRLAGRTFLSSWGELIAGGDNPPAVAIRRLLVTVYHMTPFLRSAELGFHVASGVTRTFDLSGAAATKRRDGEKGRLLFWPRDGSVLHSYDAFRLGSENPDPFPHEKDSGGPRNVTVLWIWGDEIQPGSVRLVDETESRELATTLEKGTLKALQEGRNVGSFFMANREALQPGHRYLIRGKDAAGIEFSSRFSTAPKEDKP